MDTKMNIEYGYNIIYKYEVNIDYGYGYRYSIVLDTNMNTDMDTCTRYGMLFVPYCLSITLVSENYKTGGKGRRYEKFEI